MEATVTESVAAAATKAASGITSPRKTIIVTGLAYAVTPDDHGALIQCSADGAVVSLPTGLPAGFKVKVQNIAADTAALVSISPAATHAIKGTVIGAARVQSGGAVNKDWQNTKATAEQGDYSEVEYDGLLAWWLTGGTGVWISEA
jgi:hypothetical protein